MDPTLAHLGGPASTARILAASCVAFVALGSAAHAQAPDPVALSRAAFDRGLAARRAGDLPEACEGFREAVAHLDVWPLARFEDAQCQRLVTPACDWEACASPATDGVGACRSRRAEALASLDAAGRGGVRSPAVLIEVARVHEDAGDPGAARASYEAASTSFPAEIRALEGLARTAGDRPDARRDLEAWLARSPHDLAALWRLAEVCEVRGDVACAEAAWLRFADRAVARPRAAALLRRFAARTGSRATLERARKLEPRRASPRRKRTDD
jgi:hypothetical protein